MAMVSLTGFLSDFTSAAPVPLIVVQGEGWGLSPLVVNEAGNLNVAFLAVGGLFWGVYSDVYGRLPVLFWSVFLGALCVLATALAPSFEIYYAFRALTGFFLSSGQVVGLALIHDMFNAKDHARATGIWVAFYVISPYLGPLIANFMLAAGYDWRSVLWVVFGVVVADLLLIVTVGQETYYDSSWPQELQPSRPHGVVDRTKSLVGIWQSRNRDYFIHPREALKKLLVVASRPVVCLTFLVYMMTFMWAVGINITSAQLFSLPASHGGYGFGLNTVGFLYFSPVVGALVGEVIGHWLNDFVAARYHEPEGVDKVNPETRLLPTILATVLMIPGLVMVGFALQTHAVVAIIIVGWGMYVCGAMISSVTVSVYLLEAFPACSAEASAIVNAARSLGGFSVGYYQTTWGDKVGFLDSFGTQAGIVGFATLLVLFLMLRGQKLRRNWEHRILIDERSHI
jgi:MFS family permease